MLLGDKIKKIRKEKNLTQKAVAEKASISRSYLADVENNRYNPSLDTMKCISTALEVDIKYFFDNKQTEPDTLTNLSDFSVSEEKDIKKAITSTLEQLENAHDGLMFDGEILDDETRELLIMSLERSMKLAKKLKDKNK